MIEDMRVTEFNGSWYKRAQMNLPTSLKNVFVLFSA